MWAVSIRVSGTGAAAGTRFGAGIVPAAGSGGTGSGKSSDDSAKESDIGAPAAGTGSVGGTLKATDDQVESAADAGSATGTALTIGAVGAVVLIGGIGGVLLRRWTSGD